MNPTAPIKNRIAALRKHRGISQEALAADLFIERNYLSKVKRGKVTPSGALMAAVCRRLGLQLGEVFFIEVEGR